MTTILEEVHKLQTWRHCADQNSKDKSLNETTSHVSHLEDTQKQFPEELGKKKLRSKIKNRHRTTYVSKETKLFTSVQTCSLLLPWKNEFLIKG